MKERGEGRVLTVISQLHELDREKKVNIKKNKLRKSLDSEGPRKGNAKRRIWQIC